MTHSEDVVEKVAERICSADTTSWKHTDDTQAMPDVSWSDMNDGTWLVPYEGISLGRDHYRVMARAALDAIDALYADEVTL